MGSRTAGPHVNHDENSSSASSSSNEPKTFSNSHESDSFEATIEDPSPKNKKQIPSATKPFKIN